MKSGSKSLHGNQKPVKLMERIIGASTDPGDVIWDPFGGLCSGAVAAMNLEQAVLHRRDESRLLQAGYRALRTSRARP